jgi:Ca-activated chloride channel family protein
MAGIPVAIRPSVTMILVRRPKKAGDSAQHRVFCDAIVGVMKRLLSISICSAFGILSLWMILPVLSASGQVPTHPKFRAQTDLVYLTVSVTDKHGKPIGNLRAEEFRVYENNIEQTVQYFDHSKAPLTVGLVLDRSGSMQSMLAGVHEAALHLLASLETGDESFAIAFDDQPRLVQPFTADPREVQRALSGLTAHGKTALYDAVVQGLEYIQQASNPRKILFVVSDGQDNHSTICFRDLLKRAEESDVLIYTVGMLERMSRPQSNISYRLELEKLAEVTGGSVYFPVTVDECRRKMREISLELGTLYEIGYYPSNITRDGRWRPVKVVLRSNFSNSVLRTRRGYSAPNR